MALLDPGLANERRHSHQFTVDKRTEVQVPWRYRRKPSFGLNGSHGAVLFRGTPKSQRAGFKRLEPHSPPLGSIAYYEGATLNHVDRQGLALSKECRTNAIRASRSRKRRDTENVNERSLTVGMTRHTDEYGMFYSREAVGSYDDLVALGLRTRSKELASDYREIDRARLHEPPGREITIRELRRELEGVARGREPGTATTSAKRRSPS
jgi:hypothetical protein